MLSHNLYIQSAICIIHKCPSTTLFSCTLLLPMSSSDLALHVFFTWSSHLMHGLPLSLLSSTSDFCFHLVKHSNHTLQVTDAFETLPIHYHYYFQKQNFKKWSSKGHPPTPDYLVRATLLEGWFEIFMCSQLGEITYQNLVWNHCF